MKRLLKILQEDTREMKKQALKRMMIKYYNTINQGKVSIPSFLLAEYDINEAIRQGRLNELYRKLTA